MASVFPTLRFISQHPLCSEHRLAAFWRYTRWQIKSRIYKEIEHQWIAGAKLVAKPGMTGATGNIYCWLHEFEDMAFTLHFLRPGDLFIDVGANVGSYTILASYVCGAQTIAIEPDPVTINYLMRNINANHIEDRVSVVEAALGAYSGYVHFTVGKDTTNSVSDEGGSNTQTVELKTMDDILAPHQPALIKMDMEGYETEVLSGASKTIAKDSLMAVITENNAPEIRNALESRGFQIATYRPFQRKLELVTPHSPVERQNTLFVRDVERCQATLLASPYRKVGTYFL